MESLPSVQSFLASIMEANEEGNLDEKFRIKVNAAGKKIKRKVCPPGMKLVDGRCVIQTGSERNKLSRSQKKGARKRKVKKAAINRKRKKAMRIRKSKGLDRK